uniref:Tudor domain containing 7 a n=1 Tax=Echeneis naucrates TaxID=173247 RepID=A0A665TH26_ECHNA
MPYISMPDTESIKKMLRSVLQASKAGISINNLQSEYRSLCGESIPLKELGYSKLDEYLKSIPSVVRLDYRNGELKCFASVCQETAHIAELVARQKSSKQRGHSQVINCKMRFKPSNPYMLNIRPRSCLRQPSAPSTSKWLANHSRSHGGYRGFSASGDYRQLDQRLSSITPVEHRQPVSRPKLPEKTITPNQLQVQKNISLLYNNMVLVQSRITKLLEKYSSGLWMLKLPAVYNEMFGQKLPPQVLADLEKWTHVCMVEEPHCNNRVDRLVYPPLSPKLSTVPQSSTKSPPTSPSSMSPNNMQVSSCPLTPEKQFPLSSSPTVKSTVSSKSPWAMPTSFPPQPAARAPKQSLFHDPLHDPALAPQLPPRDSFADRAHDKCQGDPTLNTSTYNQNTSAVPTSIQPSSDILPLLKVTFSPNSDTGPKSSAVTVSDEVRQRIKELLSKYSLGLWAHALPELFMDTYKMSFPEEILNNLSLLLDICTVEYPIPGNKNKAILYNSNRADMEANDDQESPHCRSQPLPSDLQVISPVIPPCLSHPSEQYPSVLVIDAKSTNAVTVRYVGENYSNAQEAMENAMCSFYSQGALQQHPSKLVVGQLVAIRGEDGEEMARAQVMEVKATHKVKVYYVDYGFSVETSQNSLFELQENFLTLPLQATNVILAGLESFSSHPSVLSSLEKLAVGKIMLMESLEPLEQTEMPVAVLYDTTEDDDININSVCLKTLQDKTMNNPLTINATYQDVCVTNVSTDGIIHCQLPSRGIARLSKLLEKTEAFFMSQMTSECLVSRPFSGKFCLARHNGKWSRVEITTIYSNRVMEILFIDLGITATVEVTDLREIPPLLLKDFVIIPPQAIRFCLADVKYPEGDWNPKAVQWVKEAVLGSRDCKMKILKLDQHKGDWLVHMYLFIGSSSQELEKSINYELAQSDLWQKITTQNTMVKSNNSSVDTGLSALVEKLTLSSPVPTPVVFASSPPCQRAEDQSLPDTTETGNQPLPMPPSLKLPQPGQNIDVFVPVACHPGYFVLQPWQDLHKLVVLMGEMILYYNQTWKTNTTVDIQKGNVYAARIDKNWHRVQVKGIMANSLVSVYELDHGKHELVHSHAIRPLIEEFRQLPFQALTAELAGVTQHTWSEEAAMLFRNHVEKRALVAYVESVQDKSEIKGEPWQPQLTVYLVDTTLEDKDLWIHSILANIGSDLFSAA